MPIPGQHQPLIPGHTLQLVSPIGPGVNQPWQVEIDNISPWAVHVHVSGQTYGLGPGVAHLYAARTGPAAVTVTPITPPGAVENSAFYVLTNWAQHPDSIPGTFPAVIAPSPQNLGLDTLGTPLAEMVAELQAMTAELQGIATVVNEINGKLP